MPAARHTALYQIAALLAIIPLLAFVQASGGGDPVDPGGSETSPMRQPAGGDDDADLPDDSGSDDDPQDDPDDDPDNDSNGQPNDGYDFSPDDVHYDEHGFLHTSEEILIKLREYLGLDTAPRSGCTPPDPLRCPLCQNYGSGRTQDQPANEPTTPRAWCDACIFSNWALEFCADPDCCHDRVCCSSLPTCLIEDCLDNNPDSACTHIPKFCGFNPPTACELNDCDPDNGCYSYPKCDDADPCTADGCNNGVCSYTASPCDPDCYDLEAKCLAQCLNAPTPECCSDPCGSACDSPMAKCQEGCQGSHPECCEDPDPCCGVECSECETCVDGDCVNICGDCEVCDAGACRACDPLECEECVAGECVLKCGLNRSGEPQECCEGECCDKPCCGTSCCAPCFQCDTSGEEPACVECNDCQKCEGGECERDLEKECASCDTGNPAPEYCQQGECVPVSCVFSVQEPSATVCRSVDEWAEFEVLYDCAPDCGLALDLIWEPLFVPEPLRAEPAICSSTSWCGEGDDWIYFPYGFDCPLDDDPDIDLISVLPGWEANLDCNDYEVRVTAFIEGVECASDTVFVTVRDPDIDIEGIPEKENPPSPAVPGVADECEWDFGGFIPWNIDDDNANGVSDLADFTTLGNGGAFTPPAEENDLVKFTIELPPDFNSSTDLVKLRYNWGQDRIRIYHETNGMLTRLAKPAHTWIPGSGFTSPATLWVEGIAPSQALPNGTDSDTNLTLIHEHPAGPLGEFCEDWLRWTIIGVDLDVDSDNDGTIDPNNSSTGTDDKIEADPTKPGKILAVNDDFDEGKVDGNGNPVPDNADLSPVTADGSDIKTDDMVRCDAEIFPKNDPEAVIKLTSSSSLVRVLAKNPNAAHPFVQGEDWQVVPFNQNLAEDYFTQDGDYFGWQWWIEGLAPGVETLTFKYEGHNLTLEDKVRLTVVKVTMVTPRDTNGNGLVDDPGNEFAYDSSNPGRLTIPVSVAIEPDDTIIQATLANHVRFRLLPPIQDSHGAMQTVQLTWSSAYPLEPRDGLGVYSSGLWQATAIFTGLPDSNDDFGLRTCFVELLSANSNATFRRSEDYEIFFPPLARNNPGPPPDSVPTTIDLNEVEVRKIR